ncbi:MAG: hypothetical protein P0Y66_10395 [Candidatus Kaistia colombiensis]|nr:MAG: hypothetical protein P0Y66_10395 [Kaistia sp.]
MAKPASRNQLLEKGQKDRRSRSVKPNRRSARATLGPAAAPLQLQAFLNIHFTSR